MRRRAFALTVGSLALLSATGSLAALPPRIAIVPSAGEGVTATDSDRFAARLGHAILEHPAYELVTRARLDAALREQGLSNSAYADPQTSAKLGKVIGASHILHVTMSIDVDTQSGLVDREKYDITSDYEFIEVSTARITSTGTAEGSSDRSAPGGGSFTESAAAARRVAIDACAQDLVDQLRLA